MIAGLVGFQMFGEKRGIALRVSGLCLPGKVSTIAFALPCNNKMIVYIVKRLAYGLLVLVLVVMGISALIFLAPVDPAQLTFGQRSDVSTVAAKRAELGLDKPLYVQLGWYFADLSPVGISREQKPGQVRLFPLGGGKEVVLKAPDLRDSYQTGRPVWEILAEAVPSTALLAGAAMVFALVFGVVFGVLSAVYVHRWPDRLLTALAVLGYSVPSYVAAMAFALLFGYVWSWWTGLSVQGSLRVLDDFGEWRWRWDNLVLPALALGIRPVALLAQLTRSALLEVLSQDYVRTARAKGLPGRLVLWRHALRNALNPLVSAVSGWFAALLTGAFFVENVFNFKGLGDVTVQALLQFDVPVVLGGVLFTTAAFVLLNIAADVLYGVVDPRVRVIR